jgi:1,2-dihydroxy-3-keto-5-methylthiopentene dioxygenase
VQAWYMDDTTEEEDQRLPHRRQPDVPVPLSKLLGTPAKFIVFLLEYDEKSFGVHTRKNDMCPVKVCTQFFSKSLLCHCVFRMKINADLGIFAMRLDADNHENDENLTMIRSQRGYLHMVSLLTRLTY